MELPTWQLAWRSQRISVFEILTGTFNPFTELFSASEKQSQSSKEIIHHLFKIFSVKFTTP